MIRVEFEHDIRVATYGLEVVSGDAFEVLDELADLIRRLTPETRRLMGLAAVALGVFLVALARFLGA